jgi:hypothetical protein
MPSAMKPNDLLMKDYLAEFSFVEIDTSEAVDAGLRYTCFDIGSQSLPFFGWQNTTSTATIDRL